MHKSMIKQIFLHISGHHVMRKLCLKPSNCFVWKLSFRQKRKVKRRLWGPFRICRETGGGKGGGGEWGAETFSDRSETQTRCDIAVIDTDQWVYLEKVWLFNVTSLFNVAPLASSWQHLKTSTSPAFYLQ